VLLGRGGGGGGLRVSAKRDRERQKCTLVIHARTMFLCIWLYFKKKSARNPKP
jgi:hypothetical protein